MEMRRHGRGRCRRAAMVSLATFCALIAVAAAALAAGSAHKGFPRRGTETEGIGLHFSGTGFSALGLRPDGGLVAEREHQLESFLPNGAPDPAAPPRLLPSYSRWFPLAGGKSLLESESKLTRLNPDGSVDTSFGEGGSIAAPPYIYAAAELPSGQILVTGLGSIGTHTISYFVTYELLAADGSLVKTGAGSEGSTLSLPFEGGEIDEIAPVPGGGALIVGRNFLLELRADGTPNLGFGANGLVIHKGISWVGAQVQPDGSVHAVGTAPGATGEDFLYVHLTPAGAPDPSFGDEGARLFDFGGEDEARVAGWGADGSVVVGGSSLPHGSCFETVDCAEVPIVAAFDPAGNLEAGFGTGGVVRLEALRGLTENLNGDGVENLVRRADGTLVAAGTGPPGDTVAFLAALSPQGTPLPGFGEGGIVRERRANPAEQTIAGIVPAGQGKVLALGISTLGFDRQPVLVRYAPDGNLDRSFGGGTGYVVLGKARFVEGLAADGSGHLLTALYRYPHSQLIEIRAADGARERSFGSKGAVTLPRRTSVNGLAYAPGGGAIVAGTRNLAGLAEPGVVLRYGADGSPDRKFGAGGTVDLVAPGRREMRARALAVVPGDRTLVAGFSGHDFALVQLLGNGRPDPRFGSDGWKLTAPGGKQLAGGNGLTGGVALERDGSHIYLAGVTRAGKRFRLVLLRFDRDGRPDRSFGHGGRRTAPIPQEAEPRAIVSTRHRTLVVLDGGPRPLVTFADGRVRSQAVGRGRLPTNVRAVVSGSRLVLGWSARGEEGSDSYFLGERPLGGS